MKKRIRLKQRKGVTFVEIALVLAVMGFLAALVLTAGGGIFGSAKIASARESVTQLYSASMACWSARGKTSYDGISITKLAEAKCLPSNFTGTSANPWGGNFQVQANPSDNNKLDIILTGIPTDAGSTLQEDFAKKATQVNYDGGTKKLTITF